MKLWKMVLIALIETALLCGAVALGQQKIDNYCPPLMKLTLAEGLDELNEGFNSEYFDEKLPDNIVIDWGEYDENKMGSTNVLKDGRFHIALNAKYSAAYRTAALILLHEDCHVLTWTEEPKVMHGPRWKTCMLNLYQQGAFKPFLIDGLKWNSQN